MTEVDIEKVARAVLARIQDGTWDRPLLSPKTLAERLEVSERQARNLIAGPNPQIPSFKIDGARRIDPREVDRFLESKQGKAA
jgi:hypothetical protein